MRNYGYNRSCKMVGGVGVLALRAHNEDLLRRVLL